MKYEKLIIALLTINILISSTAIGMTIHTSRQNRERLESFQENIKEFQDSVKSIQNARDTFQGLFNQN